MQALSVAVLGPTDLDEVMALERICFRTHWTREQFLLGLQRGAFFILGIRQNAALAAYAAFSIIAGEMEIMNIATHPFHRRKGMAKALLTEVLRICVARQVLQGFLEVRRSNAPAIDLYEKLGFSLKGTRKNYYPDNNEDALLYRLDFPAQEPTTSEHP